MALNKESVTASRTSTYNAAVRFIDRNLELGLGEKTAIVDDSKVMTYRDLSVYVNRIGHGLKSLGVSMENRVLLICDDSCEFVGTFFGAIKVGAVPVPTNTMLSVADYLYMLNDSRAVVAIVEDRIWDQISKYTDEIKYVRHVVVISRRRAPGGADHGPDSCMDRHADSRDASMGTNLTSRLTLMSFEGLIEGQPAELQPAPTVPDDMAFWLYTSGSTGRPKGVVHLQHDMECAYENYAKPVLGMTANDITFSASKLFFAYGMGNGMYFALAAGGTTVLMRERATPAAVFSRIQELQPTLFFGVPTLYAAMLNEASKSDFHVRMSSLRLCVSAGEPLAPSIFQRFHKTFGVEILDGIGSTEALHIYISNRAKEVRPGSTGQVVAGYEVKVVDEEGNPLPAGEQGQLMLKGDSIASGYWNLHEQTKRRFYGEWYMTGDRYYYDQDGYFWYCGRQDDMMKSGGIWVSPIEIENTLMEHDSVLEVGVVGVKDEFGLEKPIAYVVPKQNTDLSTLEETLREFIRDRLAHYKCPKRFEFVSELPKTETGKIQRFKLREQSAVAAL